MIRTRRIQNAMNPTAPLGVMVGFGTFLCVLALPLALAEHVDADGGIVALTSPEVVRYSAVGPGKSGRVVVSEGEDWWLPDRVEWSDYGAVIAGYGEPWGKENNWVCRGQAYWMCWKGLEKEPGKLNARFLNSLLTRYGSSVPPKGKKPKILHINIHGTDCGSYAPQYLSRPPYNVPLLHEIIDTHPKRIPPKIVALWKGRWTGHLEWAYPFWHPVFIERRLAFHTLLAGYLKKHPYGDVLKTLPVMGEFGTLWMYVKYGLVSQEVVDQAAEAYVRSALASGIAAEKWLINLAVGGRAYEPFAQLALKYRTGIGNHGAVGLIPYQFAQHLAHLRYDERLRAYVQVQDRLPYAFFHTDCEYLLHTPNTRGQYRLFRLGCLTSVALGVNRLLITASDIPSMGHERPWKKRKGFFDWRTVKAMGGLQFVEWINRTLGRPVEEAPEAYCALVQSGTPLPEGVDFSETVKQLKRGGAWRPFPRYIRTPLLTHFGRYCHLDVTVAGGAGEPVLKMDAAHLGKTHPSLECWEFGQGVYEARATRRVAGAPCLYFRVDNRFAGPERPANGIVIKVTFANDQNGTGAWTVQYDGKHGWAQADTVRFVPERGGEMKLWTATFNLPDARLADGGPEGTDFAVRALSGADAAFLLVRVIRSDAGP